MKLLLSSVFCLQLLKVVTGSASDDAQAFDELKKWLVSGGAEVNQALRGDLTQHGGANIRGVVTESGLPGDYKTLLFKVPKKLWLVLGNFPSFSGASLPVTHECEDLAPWEAYRLKLAAAMVSESGKGAKSIHHVHLQHLPTASDFHSFLPSLMEETLQHDFSALPVVGTVKEVQSYDRDYNRPCFAEWQKTAASPAAGLSWDDVHLALTNIRTRSYGTDAGTAIVPGTDMLNVAKADDLNTYWSASNEAFSLHTRVKDVASGQELYESYCQDCDNSAMLKIWGVYMEDNPNPVDSNGVVCSAHKHGTLQKAMEYVLEPKSASPHWRSPRCRAAVFSTTQGPTRCSLARLTWEYCAVDWGLASASNSTLPSRGRASLLSHVTTTALSPREDAMLVLRSAIRDVPKALRHGRARKATQPSLRTDAM